MALRDGHGAVAGEAANRRDRRPCHRQVLAERVPQGVDLVQQFGAPVGSGRPAPGDNA